MGSRKPVPTALIGRQQSLIQHFLRDYEWAAEQEREMPKEQKLVTKIGPDYAAIGWLLYRERHRRKRRKESTDD